MPQSTFISPENHWTLWAILLTVAALGILAENTRWGARLSAAVISIAGGFLLSNLSLIPVAAPAYDVVWSYFVPLAIPLLLLKADIRRIIREAGPTLIAFGIGAVGTVAGTVVAFHLLPLGEEAWKLAAIFCSTYIGGSMNFVAASKAVGLESGDFLTAGIAADNLVMALYFLLLFALPSSRLMQRLFPTGHQSAPVLNPQPESSPQNLGLRNLSVALCLSAAMCAIGFAAEAFTGVRGSAILIITALVVLLATLFPGRLGRIAGADILGMYLMQIFFAVIGASANIQAVLKVGPILFLFAAVILSVHLLFLLGFGKLFKLDLAEMVIASNANMGGPTTAAAMAVARKWQSLVIPAILCGTLGYAVATFIGVAVGFWLK